MKNIAIILAGGSGSRLGGGTPKQFLKVAGKKIIEHTIDVFEHHSLIDEICIVCKIDYIEEVERLVVANQYKKVRKILIGGAERYQSSLAAINAYTADEDNLIFHDAVRPLVCERIIDDCISSLQTYNAVDVAIKTTDTIISVNKDNCIDFIPTRSLLRNGQTPQCFKRWLIKKAYDKALQDPAFQTTDDCGVVRTYLPEEEIYVVDGENYNMKLTYVEDLFLLDKLFQLKTIKGIEDELTKETKNGIANKVVVVFGGSAGIGKAIMDMRMSGSRFYSFSRSQNGVDVSDMHSVEAALQMVYEKEGRIDVIINTAGVLFRESIDAMPTEDIRSSIDTNLIGTINVAKCAFRYLKESKGSLLFYTSSSYTRGRMMYSVYSATKAAIVNFVQAIAEEWQDFGIRVNCINPERTKTPMRIKNFGIEPETTLLNPNVVAIASLNAVFSSCSGEIIEVRKKGNVF